MTSEFLHKILVAHFPGFRSNHLRRLRIKLGDFGKAHESDAQVLRQTGIKENVVRDFIEWRTAVHIENILEVLRVYGIRIIFLGDENYPQLLSQTSDPPEALFIRGDIQPSTSISFVGSRKYSQYGQICINLLIPDAVAYGLSTVSGLALGIDSLVHKKTVDCGGVTIAVLGTGVDTHSIYPKSNHWLAERILDTGGVVLSEFPPGTTARKEHFPMRNRIIAGLSPATVVIEAGQRSGSLITARLALEENREVFAVPGPITKQTSVGTNRLLNQGAIPCVNFTSVLEGISLDIPERRIRSETELPLSLNERKVMGYLKHERHTDELADLTDLDVGIVGSVLASLELRGLIRNHGSQKWLKEVGLP